MCEGRGDTRHIENLPRANVGPNKDYPQAATHGKRSYHQREIGWEPVDGQPSSRLGGASVWPPTGIRGKPLILIDPSGQSD